MICQCNYHDDVPCHRKAYCYVTRDGLQLAVCDRCDLTEDEDITTMDSDNVTDLLDKTIEQLCEKMMSAIDPSTVTGADLAILVKLTLTNLKQGTHE